MSIPVIAIFDIGKTNKKFFLFDEDYNIVFEKSEILHEIKDEDGFPCEDIHELIKWVNTNLDSVLKLKDFKIKAINFSAHGASFVHLNDAGEVIAPLYNYLKPFPDYLKDKFDQDYSLNDVCLKTSSPDLGNLNSGLQLYMLKYEKPDIFKKIKYSFHLPEFISYLVTQQKVSGLTSIGCHTLLWDFESGNYHPWVEKESITSNLLPIAPTHKTFQISIGSNIVQAGIGIHDSSAALVPYLKKVKTPFVLISTGTWSISLNPFNHIPLTREELDKDCLCYLRYDGKPVKASRYLIGPEHDEQVKRIAEYFHLGTDFYKAVPAKNKSEFVRPLKLDFTEYYLNQFTSADIAYHALMMCLVAKQHDSTQLVLKNTPVEEIYVDGGFGGNSVYMNLLSSALQKCKVIATSVPQASALGAAMVIQ